MNRVKKIIKVLRREYPRSKTSLKHKTPFELLVATILSAQCTDKHVNKITPELFKKYNGPSAFSRAKQPEIEKYIRSAGFYRNKAKNIIAASKKIVGEFGRKVPRTMEGLLGLPGVARKTANIVLSSCFDKAEGIAVDTHVGRLSVRMGFSAENNPNKIERDLMRIVPRGDWIEFNYMLVNHGRNVCSARKPACGECPVAHLCPKIL